MQKLSRISSFIEALHQLFSISKKKNGKKKRKKRFRIHIFNARKKRKSMESLDELSIQNEKETFHTPEKQIISNSNTGNISCLSEDKKKKSKKMNYYAQTPPAVFQHIFKETPKNYIKKKSKIEGFLYSINFESNTGNDVIINNKMKKLTLFCPAKLNENLINIFTLFLTSNYFGSFKCFIRFLRNEMIDRKFFENVKHMNYYIIKEFLASGNDRNSKKMNNLTFAVQNKNYIFIPITIHEDNSQKFTYDYLLIESLIEYYKKKYTLLSNGTKINEISNFLIKENLLAKGVSLYSLPHDKIVISRNRLYYITEIKEDMDLRTLFTKENYVSHLYGHIKTFADFINCHFPFLLPYLNYEQPLLRARLLSTYKRSSIAVKLLRHSNSSSSSYRLENDSKIDINDNINENSNEIASPHGYNRNNLKKDIFLVPQSCILHPLSISLWLQISFLPSIMYSLERKLLLNEFNCINDFLFSEDHLDLLDISLTINNNYMDYQDKNDRWEYLGDSVLNTVVSIHLVNSLYQLNASNPFTTVRENDYIRQWRHKLIQNQTLYEISLQMELFKFIKTNLDGPKKWESPSFTNMNNISFMRSISAKTMANIMESIIGLLYLTSSYDKVHSFLIKNKLFIEFDENFKKLFKQKTICINFSTREENSELARYIEIFLNYTFKNKVLLNACGKSFKNNDAEELFLFKFLGSSIMELWLTQYLYNMKNPCYLKPGEMSMIKETFLSQNFSSLFFMSWHNSEVEIKDTYFQEFRFKIRTLIRNIDENNRFCIYHKQFKSIFDILAGTMFLDCQDLNEVLFKIDAKAKEISSFAYKVNQLISHVQIKY